MQPPEPEPGIAGAGDAEGDQPRPKYANTAEIMKTRMRVIKVCLRESEMITNHFPAVRKPYSSQRKKFFVRNQNICYF